MNVVDSSGWLEYFSGTPRAEFFAEAINDIENLLVPVITLYEVFKKVTQERGRPAAMQAIVAMRMGKVVPVSDEIALTAASLSLAFKLPMADAIILASCQHHHAILLTQDAHFQGIDGVVYISGA
jgi:predicted nucleic acid-binding protein